MGAPFFFILGRPRSGTTLLKTLFDAHPNVRIPPELPIFLPLYQKFKHVKTWDQAQILSFVDHVFQPNVFNNRRLENLKIDRETFTNDLLKLVNNCSIQDLLAKLNEHAFSIFPKEEILLVGDKNPVYSVYTKRLLRIFPKAKFICIVRDYRDNFVSLKNLEGVKMEAPVLTLQVARWVYITKLFMAFQKRFPEKFYIIRYEDLVTNPRESFNAVCSFLGIPFNAEVFEYHTKKDELLKIFPNPVIVKIHKSLMDPVNTGRMDLWKKQLTEQEVVIADQIAGKTADMMGYQRQSTSFSLAIYLKSLPMAMYCAILFKLMQWGAKLPYRNSRWLALNITRLAGIHGRFAHNKKDSDKPHEQ